MASDGGVTPLQTAMKMAKVAIQCDGGGEHKEAYCGYLRTMNYISHALLEDAATQSVAASEELAAVEVERMLTLAEQCLERARSFVEEKKKKSADPPDLATAAPASSSCPTAQSEAHRTTALLLAIAANAEQREGTDPTPTGGERSLFLPPEIFQKIQKEESRDTSRKELTPIEQASRLNQKLKANFQARLARLAPGQASQKTSLMRTVFPRQAELRAYWRKLKAFVKKLSLQRQMMENLIIAKARQDALQRKMEERRLRLQEEANRRFSASGSMTAEEQEQRLLYTNVLEYEQDHDWPKLWKANMKQNPDDVTSVSRLVSYLLSRSDHPVVKLLRKHQYRVYDRLYPIVSKGIGQSPALQLRPSRCRLPSGAQRRKGSTASGVCGLSPSPSFSHDLPADCDDDGEEEEEDGDEPHTRVTVDRENSFEDLEQFLTQLDWAPPDDSADNDDDPELMRDNSALNEGHVEELEMRAMKEHLKATVKDVHIAIDQLLSLCLLSFECLNTASSKDLCLASIEEAFFAPLWSALLALFRKVNVERERAYETSTKLYRDVSPADLGVPLKLFPQEPDALQGSYPYESAVQELRLLVNDCCPQKKLECIVRTLRVICACAEDYQCLHEVDPTPRTAAIGADDLLPILSFVALRSQCPQLVSECAALEEFIHEGFLIGEEGYCLTSLQSALAYVESLHTGATAADQLV